MRGDPYYNLVLDRPLPMKLVRDLEIAPVARPNRGSWHAQAFRPRPRHERGTVAYAHDLHLRTLRAFALPRVTTDVTRVGML